MIIGIVEREKVAMGLHKEVLPRLSNCDALMASRWWIKLDEVIG